MNANFFVNVLRKKRKNSKRKRGEEGVEIGREVEERSEQRKQRSGEIT